MNKCRGKTRFNNVQMLFNIGCSSITAMQISTAKLKLEI